MYSHSRRAEALLFNSLFMRAKTQFSVGVCQNALFTEPWSLVGLTLKLLDLRAKTMGVGDFTPKAYGKGFGIRF